MSSPILIVFNQSRAFTVHRPLYLLKLLIIYFPLIISF